MPRGIRGSTLRGGGGWTSPDDGWSIEGGRTDLGSVPNGPPRSASGSRCRADPSRSSRPAMGQAGSPNRALQEDHLMQTFIVEAANRPGELARVTDTIARRGINVETFCV